MSDYRKYLKYKLKYVQAKSGNKRNNTKLVSNSGGGTSLQTPRYNNNTRYLTFYASSFVDQALVEKLLENGFTRVYETQNVDCVLMGDRPLDSNTSIIANYGRICDCVISTVGLFEDLKAMKKQRTLTVFFVFQSKNKNTIGFLCFLIVV